MEEDKKVEMEDESIIPGQNNNVEIKSEPETVEQNSNLDDINNDGHLKKQEKNNNKGNILVLILLGLFVVCAIVYVFVLKPAYEKDKKNNGNNTNTNEQTNDGGNNQNVAVISEDEAVTIAKQKLEEANNFLNYDDSSRETYSNEGDGQMFTYYNTIENFKKEFYSVYSSQLSYKDVLLEYNLETNDNPNYSTNVDESLAHDLVQGYAIKDNKVYANHCMVGSGSFKRADKFVVDDITSDTIKVSYTLISNSFPEIPEESEEIEDGNATMTLVKENGEWKILKATIRGMCNALYEIGK